MPEQSKSVHNFTIDAGNTNCTIAKFQNGKLLSTHKLGELDPQELHGPLLISQVGALPAALNDFETRHITSLRKNNKLFEMPINYGQGLGADRLAACYASFKQLQANECALVVDAGTFLTIDLVDHEGHQGGWIFPGRTTLLKAYTLGRDLPDLELSSLSSDSFPPHNTDEAILKTHHLMFKSSLIEVLRSTLPTKVLIAGGDRVWVQEHIRKIAPSMTIHERPHLVHEGLNYCFENIRGQQ